MSISSTECKIAIVDYVIAHPGCIQQQYVDEQVDEAPARKISNWKRFIKEKACAEDSDVPSSRFVGVYTRRGFECRGYGDGDELRAYTLDDGTQILNVYVQGE